MNRVVVLGDLMADVVVAHDGPIAAGSDTPARIRFRPGGSAAHAAAWPAPAGAEVTLIRRGGTDAAAGVALGRVDRVELRGARRPHGPTRPRVLPVPPR